MRWEMLREGLGTGCRHPAHLMERRGEERCAGEQATGKGLEARQPGLSRNLRNQV